MQNAAVLGSIGYTANCMRWDTLWTRARSLTAYSLEEARYTRSLPSFCYIVLGPTENTYGSLPRKSETTVQSLVDGIGSRGIVTAYKHYRRDLYAQLVAALGRRPDYYGFHRFVLMSGYLPRNLLVILKQITRWSLFLGGRPFRGTPISLRAQREGVRDASDWFLSDAKGLGRVGDEANIAIARLGSLFRDMRYSDKPAEVSCSSFSTDRQGLSVRARSTLDEAVTHSLILRIATGRRDRNSRVLHHKYQLNPMLAPRFGLALGRRGSASFSPGLLNSVFDADVDEGTFRRERRRLLARLNPPFVGSEAHQGRLELR